MSSSNQDRVSVATLEKELDLERREFSVFKRETDLDHREREFDLKRRNLDFGSEQKQKSIEFEHQWKECQIEAQLKTVDFAKQSLALQQCDIDTQRRALEARQHDLDAQKHQLDAQQHELETQKQIFELHKKDHQTQFESMLEQHHFGPFLHVDHGLVSSDNMSSLGGVSSVPGGSGIGSGSGSGKSKGKLCSKSSAVEQSGEQFPISVEDCSCSDLKLSEIQLGKRQLKLLSEAVVRGFDDLNRQKGQFAKAQDDLEAAKGELEKTQHELKKTQHELETAQDDAEKMRMTIEQHAKAKQESQGSQKELLRGLNNLLGCKLAAGQVKRWSSVSDLELARTLKIIQDCNKNSNGYGASEATINIEFRGEPLSKEIHLETKHYFDLLRLIFDTGDAYHINPYDPKVTWTADTILSYWWKSDTDSGEAPKLTPDLKVFFSSPNISNGDWVQFHGPGTVLYQINPGFKLTVGSLCDPDGKGFFTSINQADPATDPDKYNGKTCTSPYQIKFKWE